MLRRSRGIARTGTLLCAMLFALAVLGMRPSVALAREYSIDQVSIDATIDESGALAVQEGREFNFDGEFHGVYWKLPKGDYEGRSVEPTIGAVGEMRDGSFVAFVESNSETDGTYQLSDYGSYEQVKIFSTHENESAQFVINFSYVGMVSRWQDTAELYWKFVSEGWDEPSNNVTCTVRLPVPAGAQVLPEKNVRAWGHGPLDATVDFDGNDVVYSLPGVGTSEFAEARITFPEEWVPGAQQMSQERLGSILAEEEQWANEANAERDRARMLVYGTIGLMGGYALLTLGITVARGIKYSRTHRPQFDDEYFRDVPSNDHPAVLGALYRDGDPTQDEFTASLMRLTDMGKVQLDLVRYNKKGVFGRVKEKQDYRLLQLARIEGGVRGDAVAASCDRIDRATSKFLFQTVAGHHEKDQSLVGPHGEEYVLASYFEEVARKHPESYESGYNTWKSAVIGAFETRGFNKDENKVGIMLPIGLGIGGIFVGIGGFFLGLALDVGLSLVLLLMLLNIVVSVACIAVGAKMKGLSREAIELRAKLVALRKWLKEFTRLDEAIPTDVVLWNRLLVMATALGVAEDVINQLKVALPKLLEDPYFYSYGWYYYGGHGMSNPANVVGGSFGQAHSVSAAKLSSSSSSSGGGGGGGFSGGGGGGFGGGGGGGAF